MGPNETRRMLSEIGRHVRTGTLVTHIYTADPAALVYGDRLYLYPGHDEAPAGGQNLVMRDWHVFSSTDPLNFTSHGARLRVNDFSWADASTGAPGGRSGWPGSSRTWPSWTDR